MHQKELCTDLLFFRWTPPGQKILSQILWINELYFSFLSDMFITEVDACVTGLFCFVALLTDILIVSSFFKNSKKGKKLQIGFTSLASVGLLFDAGWAFFLWYEYKIRGLEFYMLCVANGFILISVIVSYVHLFWGRKSRTYQTVNNGKEESSKSIVQVWCSFPPILSEINLVCPKSEKWILK